MSNDLVKVCFKRNFHTGTTHYSKGGKYFVTKEVFELAKEADKLFLEETKPDRQSEPAKSEPVKSDKPKTQLVVEGSTKPDKG